ncbi:hypothetical protein P167DRAFT_262129 [Morchella conica CCBAS932]|uniref:Uncharacterized protein n=1 Tax=Morchella conica CCBAS932 TaxID=1392247 RepID=A0A3N4L183_9PEZI|nr:hypothetical protein P167DRAFT_262129 [Morchella conica CCBAS932]
MNIQCNARRVLVPLPRGGWVNEGRERQGEGPGRSVCSCVKISGERVRDRASRVGWAGWLAGWNRRGAARRGVFLYWPGPSWVCGVWCRYLNSRNNYSMYLRRRGYYSSIVLFLLIGSPHLLLDTAGLCLCCVAERF